MSHANDALKRTHHDPTPLPPSPIPGVSKVTCVAPNRWCHEVPALVGPFCCRTQAVTFACPPVEFGHYEGQHRQVERRGDTFYVHVRRPRREGRAGRASRHTCPQ